MRATSRGRGLGRCWSNERHESIGAAVKADAGETNVQPKAISHVRHLNRYLKQKLQSCSCQLMQMKFLCWYSGTDFTNREGENNCTQYNPRFPYVLYTAQQLCLPLYFAVSYNKQVMVFLGCFCRSVCQQDLVKKPSNEYAILYNTIQYKICKAPCCRGIPVLIFVPVFVRLLEVGVVWKRMNRSSLFWYRCFVRRILRCYKEIRVSQKQGHISVV